MKMIRDVRVCSKTWQHATGLMFSRKRPCLLSFRKPRKVSLHTWFVFFPLDILIMNKDVVIDKYHMPCWSFLEIPGKVKDILEVPGKSTIEKGDKIRIA